MERKTKIGILTGCIVLVILLFTCSRKSVESPKTSIDSLKEISNYFSVSIDDLLSGEKLLKIAEKENKYNIRAICDLLFGMVDVCSFMLILLPLYQILRLSRPQSSSC